MNGLNPLRAGALVLLASIFVCMTNRPLYCQSMERPLGRVKGTVRFVTVDEGPFFRATITLEGEGLKRVVNITNGTFEIDAPQGIYRISASDPGSCTTRRAPFRLRASIVTTLDLPIVGCPYVDRIRNDNGEPMDPIKREKEHPKGQVDGFERPFLESSFQTPHRSGMPSELLIRFSKWDETKRVFEYQGGRVSYETSDGTQTKFLPVMVTYDLLTIYANKVGYDPRTHRLSADGNVIIEDGRQRKRVQHAELDFGARNPMSTLKPVRTIGISLY